MILSSMAQRYVQELDRYLKQYQETPEDPAETEGAATT